MEKELASQATKYKLGRKPDGIRLKSSLIWIIRTHQQKLHKFHEQAWWQEFMFKIQGSHMCPFQINQMQLSHFSKQHQSVSCAEDSVFIYVI